MITILLMISSFAHAGWDSVMLIARPEKSLVQVNDIRQNGARLKGILTALSGTEEGNVLLTSKNENVKFDCGRGPSGASCVIRILPGEGSKLSSRGFEVLLPLESFSIPNNAPTYSIDFLNSNGDRLEIRISEGFLRMTGAKR